MNAPLAGIDAGKRWAIMGAVMLALFLSAMDQTIVGTALPRIIADLSGLELYAWVFTAYMLASTTLVPVVGKMGDIYGRKRLLIIGVAIFLLGSVLSGMSQSMIQLIIFRGIQGAGGGFIFANAFAIIGDLFPPAERGKYVGLMSGVFGLASVLGPLIGGGITDHLNWRWVFYVNIPLGLAALLVIATVLPATARPAVRPKLDLLGAITLALAIVPLLLAFSWAGGDYGWGDARIVALFVLAATMAAVFIVVEARAEDPIVPLSLFRNRVFAVCSAITFVSGAAMFAGTVYIPLFMQGVLDFSATRAGLVLTPMTLSMVVGSTIGGQLMSRTGRYKILTVSGFVAATAGLFLLSRLGGTSTQFEGMRSMAILGFGIGISLPTLMLASQNAVAYRFMGVTTSLNQFSRSVGGTIGVAIMGSLLTRRMNAELASTLPPEVQSAPAPLLEALRNPRLDGDALVRLRDQGFGPLFGADAPRLFDESLAAVKGAFTVSITEVFLLATALMALAVVISLFLPEIPLQRAHEVESAHAQAPDTAEARGPAPMPRSVPAPVEPSRIELSSRDSP